MREPAMATIMETATATCTSTTKGILCSGRCDNDGCGLYDLVGWWKEREESRERKSVFEVESMTFTTTIE